jgi:glycosyltransferase involved in cell wall biosynthesis
MNLENTVGDTRPLRILVVPTTDWTRHPVPNRLNFIFDRIAQRGCVFVFHFRLARFDGLPERETRCQLVPAPGIPVKDPSLYYLLSSPFHLMALRRTVKKERIDLVLASNILPAVLSLYSGAPVVFDYLDHFEESASVYYPGSLAGRVVEWGVRALVRHAVRGSRGVITVTPAFRRHLSQVGAKNICVIPNGVSNDLFQRHPPEEAKARLGLSGTVIGYVGSLEYWVDLETVVEALQETDATLLVVGPGLFTDYGDLIRKRAIELGVIDRVVFTGQVPYEQLSWYISAMDVGLNPLKPMEKNLSTVGGKIFNYLACGVPVLSSRMPAVVEELGDVLLYYDDRSSLLQGIATLTRDPPGPELLMNTAKQYDWGRLAAEYAGFLKKTVEGAASAFTPR